MKWEKLDVFSLVSSRGLVRSSCLARKEKLREKEEVQSNHVNKMEYVLGRVRFFLTAQSNIHQ